MTEILTRDHRGKIATSTGRKPGVPNNPQTEVTKMVKKAFRTKQLRHLDKMMKMANEHLYENVKYGDPDAIAWVLNHTQGKIDQAPLRSILPDADFSTMDGVIAAGAETMALMAEGKLPLAQAEKVVAILKNYASLRLNDEIRQIEDMMKELEVASDKVARGPQEQVLNQDELPEWGKFQSMLD